MTTGRSIVLGLVLFLAGLLLGGVSVPTTVGQPAAAPAAGQPVSGGRYQMQVVAREPYSAMFLCDTSTGQCWYRTTHPEEKKWVDKGTPAAPAK
jgi:hypothetical protein